jgi:hypothetical protein
MWLVIVVGLGLGILALVGLLAVARELIFEGPLRTPWTMEAPKENVMAAVHQGDDAR